MTLTTAMQRISEGSPCRLDLESFGVRYSVSIDADASAQRLSPYLVPGSVRSPGTPSDSLFAVSVTAGDEQPEEALHRLGATLRFHVATSAENWVFVHAGVVAWRDRLVVIPGASFSGKSTLVEALLRAGATYYSDEFAVIDAEGFIHPFPKPLSIRLSRRQHLLRTPESLGAPVATMPKKIDLVVQTAYVKGTHWRPRVLTRGDVVLRLLAHTVSARIRPAATIATLIQGASTAHGVAGLRGGARTAAARILETLDRLETPFTVHPSSHFPTTGGAYNDSRCTHERPDHDRT